MTLMFIIPVLTLNNSMVTAQQTVCSQSEFRLSCGQGLSVTVTYWATLSYAKT